MSEALVVGSSLGNALNDFLGNDDLATGDALAYEQCKLLFVWHPLGGKMAEAPISMAQSQERTIAVQSAPVEVVQRFKKDWDALACTSVIHNLHSLSRVYGIASVILGNEAVKSNEPLDMWKLWEQKIFFNVLDPLNTAGSLVLPQIPNTPNFQHPVTVSTSGQTFHPSRCNIVMNEHPVFIEYTRSAFGFVGRSVFQRAIVPLKGFLATMDSDNMIAQKLGFIVHTAAQPGSIIDNLMGAIGALKRTMIRGGRTGNVITIGEKDKLETLDMTHVDTAGTMARTNILKNIATAADMPAKLLENETMVAGFGEGTEDAKNIARYIDRIRLLMQPTYQWFDNIVMYRAWNPQFYEQIQAQYPDLYEGRDFKEVFLEWRAEFAATWPSVLIEPESEQSEQEKVKLEGIIAFMQLLLDKLDPANKAAMIMTAIDNLNENKRMFPHAFALDGEALLEFLEEQKSAGDDARDAATEANGAENKMAKFA